MTPSEPRTRSTTGEVRFRASVPALVLECHHGSLGIARSLGRQGVEVHGVDADTSLPGFRSRYFRGAHAWDLLGAPPEHTVSYLLDLAKKIGTGSLLIPTSDETTAFVATHADELAERFVFAKQPAELIERLASKEGNYHLAQAAGVPVPKTQFPKSREDVNEFCARTTFPVMLKGIEGRRLFDRTGYKMLIVRSAEELLEAYDWMEDPDNPNVMLQELIPGGDDTIWIFNGYFDAEGECKCAFIGRKLRQTPPHMGSTSLGICEPNETVERMTIDFMQKIGYRGILDIGYRFDARDGQYKLLDPNPRVGSTFRLFVGTNGMDVIRYLYMDKTGQTLPETRPRHGRKWFVEESDFEAFTIYRREGELGFVDWLKSFRGVEESAWFAWDDLKPFWPTAWSITKRTIRWLGRTVLRRPAPSDTQGDRKQPPTAAAPRPAREPAHRA